MRKLFLLIFLTAVIRGQSQLSISLYLPPNGVIQKSQLWNIAITNTGSTTTSVQIEVLLVEMSNSVEVLSAITKEVLVPPGTTQLNNSILQPIQYSILNAAYNIDPSPNGLLPVGVFNICYGLLEDSRGHGLKAAEECQELVVEPLSPPQLTYPHDYTAIETTNPQFSWLPPLPISLFTNLKYDFDIVEIFNGQSAADAIQQNPWLFRQSNISSTTFLYPASAAALDFNKQYAWRVIAKNNEAEVGQSETWNFSIKVFGKVDSLFQNELPYAKLKKDSETGYAICLNELKFDYLNETADSVWNLSVFDILTPQKNEVSFPLDSVKLKPGRNLIKVDLRNIPAFIDKHLYLLEIRNSRNEIWKLKFEYKYKEEED